MKLREHAYNTILILLALVVVELISYFFYSLVFDEQFSYSGIQKLKSSIVFADESKAPKAAKSSQPSNVKPSDVVSIEEMLRGKKEVIHPYLGFVYNPEKFRLKHNGVPISEFGFIDNRSPIHKRSKDKLIVGVFGGSVAWWFQNLQRQSLIDGLRGIPKFSGKKEIVFVPVALGGYKQPQQAIALSYLLSLGAEFDLILNIDGYNEVALVNYKSVVFPFFPRSWELRVVDVPSVDVQISIGRIEYIKEQRASVAKFFYGEPYSYSIMLNTMWRLYDRYLVNKINIDRLELDRKRDRRSKDYSKLFEVKGPPYHFSSKEKLYRDIAQVWKNGSLTMRGLAEASGAEYFHFLQPNQYFPGSKVLSEEEKKNAFWPGTAFEEAVQLGYPNLRKVSKELKDKGVNFFDLSMLFFNVSETTYVDTCCHLSERGNEIMAESVVAVLSQHYR